MITTLSFSCFEHFSTNLGKKSYTAESSFNVSFLSSSFTAFVKLSYSLLKFVMSSLFSTTWYKSIVVEYNTVYIFSTSFLIWFQLISSFWVNIPSFFNSYCLFVVCPSCSVSDELFSEPSLDFPPLSCDESVPDDSDCSLSSSIFVAEIV